MNILLGPYFFIRDQSPENFWAGIVLLTVLLSAMGIGFIKPWRLWRIVVAVIAAVCWLISGVIGRGIGA